MSIRLEVYKERRVVMVRWARARSGDPHRSYPDVDDRGSRSPEFAAVIGMMAGREAYVRLERELIDDAAELFVTSSDDTKVGLLQPADGKLPAAKRMTLELSGVSGGNPHEAFIEVRFGSLTGPIVSRLLVRCYTRRRVTITPHIVTIHNAAGTGGTASFADVASIMAHVQAIWRPCGVEFTVGATLHDTVSFASADIVSDAVWPGEVAALLGTNSVPHTINAYFVRRIGTGDTLGYGFSRPSSVTYGTGNPGIILADVAGVSVHDTPWAGNDLAHEAGHFFQLWHPNQQQPPTERNDSWSRRFLMHNYNLQGAVGWKDDNGYGTHSGDVRRGALITHKHIPHIATDDECATARSAILAGPY